jgi:hypothetical protein
MGASASNAENTHHQTAGVHSDRTSLSVFGMFGGSTPANEPNSASDEHHHRHHGTPLRDHDHVHQETKRDRRHIVDKGSKFLQEEAYGLGYRHALDDMTHEQQVSSQSQCTSLCVVHLLLHMSSTPM